MTPEAQRIAIAKACGWEVSATWPQTPTHCVYRRGDELRIPKELPDYCSDLNAIHEVEKVLKWMPDDEYCQAAQYYEHLVFVCGDKNEPPDVYEWHLIRATAAQRAEAFLRTLGKWVETEPYYPYKDE